MLLFKLGGGGGYMKNSNSATKQEVVWFEKTVEYKFIADCLEKGIIKSIAPLDGIQERVGDTIIVTKDSLKNYKFYIVEFKKDLGSKGFNSEVNNKFLGKMSGYNAARDCFSDEGKPSIKGHYFVGAQYEDSNFQLIVRDYFAPSRDTHETLEDAFSSIVGMTQEQFTLYVNRFTSHKTSQKCYKCSDSDNGGDKATSPAGPNPGGNGLSVEKHISMVVAINPDNKECITFPLTSVQVTDGLGGLPEVNISPDFGGDGGAGIVIKTEIIIAHPIYMEPEPGELSHPDDLEEEIAG